MELLYIEKEYKMCKCMCVNFIQMCVRGKCSYYEKTKKKHKSMEKENDENNNKYRKTGRKF